MIMNIALLNLNEMSLYQISNLEFLAKEIDEIGFEKVESTEQLNFVLEVALKHFCPSMILGFVALSKSLNGEQKRMLNENGVFLPDTVGQYFTLKPARAS